MLRNLWSARERWLAICVAAIPTPPPAEWTSRVSPRRSPPITTIGIVHNNGSGTRIVTATTAGYGGAISRIRPIKVKKGTASKVSLAMMPIRR